MTIQHGCRKSPKIDRRGIQRVDRVVKVDATGRYLDPTVPADAAGGSLRGHLTAGAMKVIAGAMKVIAGAMKVIAGAPFKIKDKTVLMPDDAAMVIYGINHTEFDPARHHVLSAASCTTTGLAHMIKPLLEAERTTNILTASLSTIHAATNSQNVLDAVPASGAKDLRKTRSVFNNIILSSTGAARALEQVLPEIARIGFMADSVRIPTTTVSLINLNLTFSSPLTDRGEPSITRQYINDVYRAAAEGSQQGLLLYSDAQNVSADLLGVPASVVIEGSDTHTRTGFPSTDPVQTWKWTESNGMLDELNRNQWTDTFGISGRITPEYTIQRPRNANQRLREVGVDPPVTYGVGIGQRVARHTAPEAHMIELGVVRTQTGLNVTRAFPPGQLRKRHAKKLLTAREGLHFMMTLVTGDARLKRLTRQKLHELSEDNLTFVHPSYPPCGAREGTRQGAHKSSRAYLKILVTH